MYREIAALRSPPKGAQGEEGPAQALPGLTRPTGGKSGSSL